MQLVHLPPFQQAVFLLLTVSIFTFRPDRCPTLLGGSDDCTPTSFARRRRLASVASHDDRQHGEAVLADIACQVGSRWSSPASSPDRHSRP